MLLTLPPSLPSACSSQFTRACSELRFAFLPRTGRTGSLGTLHFTCSHLWRGTKELELGTLCNWWIIYGAFLGRNIFSCKGTLFWKAMLTEKSGNVLLYLLICLGHSLGRQKLKNVRIIKFKADHGPRVGNKPRTLPRLLPPLFFLKCNITWCWQKASTFLDTLGALLEDRLWIVMIALCVLISINVLLIFTVGNYDLMAFPN